MQFPALLQEILWLYHCPSPVREQQQDDSSACSDVFVLVELSTEQALIKKAFIFFPIYNYRLMESFVAFRELSCNHPLSCFFGCVFLLLLVVFFFSQRRAGITLQIS